MRISVLLFLLIGCINLSAQEAEDLDVRKVAKLAVHPNCKHIPVNKKQEQMKCLQSNLSQLLNQQLAHYMEYVLSDETKSIRASVDFIISVKGKIERIEVSHSTDRKFSIYLSRSMERVSNRTGYIEPAELEDGTQVNLKFTLPVHIRNQ